MASGAGFMIDAMNTMKRNRNTSFQRKARYTKLKEQYIGVRSENQTLNSPNLTPTQLAAGRKRAKAYYTKRNRRIYTQLLVLTLASLTLVACFFYKYLLN